LEVIPFLSNSPARREQTTPQFGSAARLSVIWGFPDAPEAFLETARDGRV
jgi:hypothetical protein